MEFLKSPQCSAPQPGPAPLDHAERSNATSALGAQAQRPVLQGKHIGLLCHARDEEAANLREAALALGARVSTIRVDLWAPQTPEEVQRLALTLGRLYDAVACEGVDAALVRQIRLASPVPLFADITRASRDIPLLGVDDRDPNRQLALLQAMLLQVLPGGNV